MTEPSTTEPSTTEPSTTAPSTTETAAPSDGRPPMVVITGPTAGGKSGLALALAEAFDGVVINADSMQVYRELRILTARPGADALARAPHRLYGVLPGREPCSAGRWREMALDEIAAARTEGRLPLVVGGTGLYLRALAEGLAPVPNLPEAVREAARARHADLGGAAFHAELAARDPVMAARLEPGAGRVEVLGVEGDMVDGAATARPFLAGRQMDAGRVTQIKPVAGKRKIRPRADDKADNISIKILRRLQILRDDQDMLKTLQLHDAVSSARLFAAIQRRGAAPVKPAWRLAQRVV